MITGIVIINSHPQRTFETFCKKHNFDYWRPSIAKDEADNRYILLSTYHSACGCQFDKIIIFSDFMYDVFSHLSPQSIGDFGKQNIIAIRSERCLYEYNL